MKLILSITLVSITVFLFIAGFGCGRRTGDQGQITVCFAFQDLETEFWVAAHKAICETLQAKWEYSILMPKPHWAEQDAEQVWRLVSESPVEAIQ